MRFAKLYYIRDITVISPELHDLAVSKCVAGRDKDAAWVRSLLRHRLIEPARLIERLRALDSARVPAVERHVSWAERRIAEAAP